MISFHLRYFSYFCGIPLSRYEYFGTESAKSGNLSYSATRGNFRHFDAMTHFFFGPSLTGLTTTTRTRIKHPRRSLPDATTQSKSSPTVDRTHFAARGDIARARALGPGLLPGRSPRPLAALSSSGPLPLRSVTLCGPVGRTLPRPCVVVAPQPPRPRPCPRAPNCGLSNARALDFLAQGPLGDAIVSSQGVSPSRPRVAAPPGWPTPLRSITFVRANWPRTWPRPCAVAVPQLPRPRPRAPNHGPSNSRPRFWPKSLLATRLPPPKEAPPQDHG